MPVNRLPLSAQTYELLLAEILAGKRPAGERISEESISQEFGISHTPAREALMRLAADGLIERTARKGCRVKGIDREQQRDVFECRAMLEAMALRLAFGRIPAGRLDEVTKALQRARRNRDGRASLDADAMLHGLITQSCPNRTLAEIIGRLLHQCKAFRALRAASADVEAISEERLDIARAISEGDRKDAERLLMTHIRRGAPE